MAIGGGHLPHIARNNVDMTYLLFNNAIYGMTKGQFSPTTVLFPTTKTSPFGFLGDAVNPSALASQFRSARLLGQKGALEGSDHSRHPASGILLHRGPRKLLFLQHHRYERGPDHQKPPNGTRGS